MVDYVPRYPQPTTLAKLRTQDVGVLSDEIARLRHSIAHLERSQIDLETHLTESDEVEEQAVYESAIKENETTIAAQNERIWMVRLAMQSKLGFDPGANPHYDSDIVPPQLPGSPIASMAEARMSDATSSGTNVSVSTASHDLTMQEEANDTEDGLMLTRESGTCKSRADSGHQDADDDMLVTARLHCGALMRRHTVQPLTATRQRRLERLKPRSKMQVESTP
ncbi:uncharacterized protein L969DRAFT_103224 [Mixia osmundae IAM 14324]|uniref:Uncharacterized protein n=1 Tax=Mixia osmundae (strain CBS 9802 / IAM 14324 / JCM 22182 / KY 12970) TaxID=764103 RepID=G7DZP0_MIXOS|nr:uncharacterized protein L969DRAFT_103224 [Mixia osmundae IAM 14324]KEI39290.1 hypothetical protein L969DRAFT_103224 [Mixia osmundae IAM 14324]GAA96050.1 hypothetical protein E5Q_02711 [Mixia osmundae IAM 14324]